MVMGGGGDGSKHIIKGKVYAWRLEVANPYPLFLYRGKEFKRDYLVEVRGNRRHDR